MAEISGIAGRRAARLEQFSIRICLELASADRLFVRRLLTRVGEALWYELRGDPVLPLYTERPPHKILSRGGSLGESTADPDRLLAWLTRNMERLVEELEFYVVRAGALSVCLSHKEAGVGYYQVDLPAPTDRFDLLMESAKYCFQRAWQSGQEVFRMHLIASQLRWPGYTQLGLFDPPEEQYRAVAEVKRKINATVGRFKLRSGATLPLYETYRDEAQGYDICDVVRLVGYQPTPRELGY